MQNTIELSDVLPKRTNTALIVIKDLYKATKIILVTGGLFASMELAKWGYAVSSQRLLAAKENFVSSQVAESLSGKTFEFDDKRGIAKPATAMSSDELLRALYLLNRRAEQRESTINHLKEILSYE